MRSLLLTAATALLVCAGGALGVEKDAKGGAGGPPPGKGWRKNEPAPTPAPMPKKKGVTPTPPAPPVAKAPAKPADGIGQQVSAWARSGIHGVQLAARIHQLQATRAESPSPAPPAPAPKGKKGKQDVTPTPPPKGKKGQPEVAPTPPAPKGKKPKDKKGEDD
jgi:hypothetical protein